MDDFGSKTVCVYDYGLNVELAVRLSQSFGRTIYFRPWQDLRPASIDYVVGCGFEGVERVRNFWDVVKDVDLFVFPFTFDPDLQAHLEGMGKRVWGARRGESHETKREKFKTVLKELGLSVSPYEVVVGMSNLRAYLKENDDCFVKLSTWRGDGETWGHKNYNLSGPKLDAMDYYYGPLKEQVRFMVEHKIDSKIEAAYDGYCIDGQFPALGIQGYEVKEEAYIASLLPYNKIPEEVRSINEAFAPLLLKDRYRNFWGTEVRVTNNDNFFLDATCRSPSPPGEIILELFGNLPEIMWHGSVGELEEINPTAKFAAQVRLYSTWSAGNWQTIEFPESIRRWVKLILSCKIDGRYYLPPGKERCPNPDGCSEAVGDVIGLGDTIEEAIENVKKHCDQVEGFGLKKPVFSLAEALVTIHEAEKEGMEFTEQEVPAANSVID